MKFFIISIQLISLCFCTWDSTVLPKEVSDNFAEYEALEERKETCNFESQIETMDEDQITRKIKQAGCVPDHKTLSSILDAGWTTLANYIIKEIYLPNFIDPSQSIYAYIHKNESKLKNIQSLTQNFSIYESIIPQYSYENLDNIVKVSIKLPDPTFSPEYYSLYCFKDMLKLNGIFKNRQKSFKIIEKKTFFSQIEGECEYSYNYFSHQFELTLVKAQKFKKWDKLFK
jgi:hypothetical protein